MERAVEAGVVTALGARWTPAQLLEHVQHLATDSGMPHECAVRILPDALLAAAFAVDPAPSLVMEYLGALCIAPDAHHTDAHEHNLGPFLWSLLHRAHANTRTANEVCEQLLFGIGDTLPASLTPARLAETVPEDSVWPTIFMLVRIALDLDAPHSAAAVLFQRLASHTYCASLPDTWAQLAHDVESARTQNSAWSTIAQVLATLEQEPEEQAPRRNHTMLPDLWSGRQTLPYALALAGAVHQLHTSGGRVPALPQAPLPEPDVMLFIYTLTSDTNSWVDKCGMAQGLLASRLAYADTEPEKIRLTFYVEILIATTQAALTCVGMSQDTASAWRAVVGGLLPPLFRYLDNESDTLPQRMLAATLTAFVELYAPLSQWAAEEPAIEPALPEHILRCMASWGLMETHISEPISPMEVVRVANPDLQQYMVVAHKQTAALGGLAALAQQAVSDPARQLCFAHVVSTTASAWTTGAVSMEQIAEVCTALSVSGACQALFSFLSRAALCDALLTALARITPSHWQSADALEPLSSVLLFLQRIATPAAQARGPAAVFLSYTQVPTLSRQALSEHACALLDQWNVALVGAGGIPDALLRDSPPWTIYRLAPTLLQELVGAYFSQRIDAAGLEAATLYFLQAPLRHTLPVVLRWLVEQAQYAHAASVYMPSKHSGVYRDLVCALLGADSCPTPMRAMFRASVLPMLDEQSALATLVKNTPVQHTPLWPSDALETALGPDPAASEAATAFLYARGPLHAALWALHASVHTDLDATDARMICAVLALANPPLSLAEDALSIWDCDRAAPVDARHLCACYLQSAALVRNLPGGSDAVQNLLSALARHGRSTLLRELLAGARPPLAALAAAIPNTAS